MRAARLRPTRSAPGANAVAAMLSRISPKTAVALGISQSGQTLQQQLAGQSGERLPGRPRPDDAGSASTPTAGTSMGVRHDLGACGRHRHRRARRGPPARASCCAPTAARLRHRTRSTLDRRIGPARLSLGVSRLTEDRTVLGARFSPAFSSGGATSWFVDGSASFDLGRGWGAYAGYRLGWTSMPGTAGWSSNGRLSTRRLGVRPGEDRYASGRRHVRFADHAAAAGPLRRLRPQHAGRLRLCRRQRGYDQRFFNLAPTGREIDYRGGLRHSASGAAPPRPPTPSFAATPAISRR